MEITLGHTYRWHATKIKGCEVVWTHTRADNESPIWITLYV